MIIVVGITLVLLIMAFTKITVNREVPNLPARRFLRSFERIIFGNV